MKSTIQTALHHNFTSLDDIAKHIGASNHTVRKVIYAEPELHWEYLRRKAEVKRAEKEALVSKVKSAMGSGKDTIEACRKAGVTVTTYYNTLRALK